MQIAAKHRSAAAAVGSRQWEPRDKMEMGLPGQPAMDSHAFSPCKWKTWLDSLYLPDKIHGHPLRDRLGRSKVWTLQ